MDTSLTTWLGDVPDTQELIRVTVRLMVALLAGALIGAQRQSSGKDAGLRTHMLVALGTAVFVLACIERGFADDAMSRVIQGLATGIGFLGAGTILKLTHERTIKGLTTAGSIWVTAAIGVAMGLGQIAVGLIAVVLTLVVLAVLLIFERRPDRSEADSESAQG